MEAAEQKLWSSPGQDRRSLLSFGPCPRALRSRALSRGWEMRQAMCGGMAAPRLTLPPESPEEEKFRHLADEWHRETDHLSAAVLVLAHRAYKQLLRMPDSVLLPLIFRDLQARPGHWFEALELATGENPAEDAQSFRAAVDAWLTWGQDHGFGQFARKTY
jgi:hypothetical protein